MENGTNGKNPSYTARRSAELTAAITALANAMALGRPTDEVVLLAVVFTQLGDTLGTIATGRDFFESEAEQASKKFE